MSENIQELNQENFASTVSGGAFLVDFWAEWCPPCRMLGPEMEKAAAQMQGKVQIVKVDTEANQDLAMQYHIRNIPCVILLIDGQEKNRWVGFRSADAIVKDTLAAL